ncbi:MAG: retron St85 family effector protein, partial [Taibaiella sp.]|nr:retron St85 family effector protein [Taibaiella sp.]
MHDYLAKDLKSLRSYLRRDSSIVFVCGADPKLAGSCRSKFLKYAEKHLANYDFFIAEDLLNIKSVDSDLLSIEDKLAQFSDCVILFLESPGAFAELGAFANKSNLTSILLAVNDSAYSGARSFINDGPINKINRESKFKPAIDVNFESVLECADEIQAKLDKELKRIRRKSFSFDGKLFEELPGKERLFVVHDLVWLLSPVKYA